MPVSTVAARNRLCHTAVAHFWYSVVPQAHGRLPGYDARVKPRYEQPDVPDGTTFCCFVNNLATYPVGTAQSTGLHPC
ncbi:hypothetical protein GCM10010121_043770 [Streptomyces brasiliensis]|uniref:Uncharacterized protein n=1 Tax=Streptomyces brasiliensis TaxID=1954 RepID=A0A917KVD2_9ACTN|nr:hypothetical protein GCM10010121_043770 [Streptomyces brasiliensis]